MVASHALIGIGEAADHRGGAGLHRRDPGRPVQAARRAARHLRTGPMQNDANRPSRSRVGWVIGALAIIAVVVVAASFLASGDPDGLERVAEDHGFIGAGEGSPFSIIADYVFPGMDGPMATVVAGLIGVAIVLGLVWLVGQPAGAPPLGEPGGLAGPRSLDPARLAGSRAGRPDQAAACVRGDPRHQPPPGRVLRGAARCVRRARPAGVGGAHRSAAAGARLVRGAALPAGRRPDHLPGTRRADRHAQPRARSRSTSAARASRSRPRSC